MRIAGAALMLSSAIELFAQPAVTINGIPNQLAGGASVPAFTWDNQDGSTVTNLLGTERLAAANDAAVIHARYVLAPVTPYTLTALVRPDWTNAEGDARFGLLFRQSSTGKIINFQLMRNSSGTAIAAIDWWNTSTSFNSDWYISTSSVWNPLTIYASYVWQRLTDDGTNLSFFYSLDGIYYTQLATSLARGSFMTGGPDEIGYFAGSNSAGNQPAVTVLSWVVH
jgi:hypothetical protein